MRAVWLLGKGHVQIRTDRLLLREFTPEDEQAYLAYQADPEIRGWHNTEWQLTREVWERTAALGGADGD